MVQLIRLTIKTPTNISYMPAAPLAYVIDRVLSAKENALVLHIREGGPKPSIRPKDLYRQALMGNAREQDKLALNCLIKGHMAHLKKKGVVVQEEKVALNALCIPYTHTREALKLLAATGQLYFGDKQLVIDLYTPVEFYYSIEHAPPSTSSGDTLGKPVVFGRIKTSSQDFTVQECDFICAGPPHWFIKGFTLKILATTISWKQLQQMFESKNLLYVDQHNLQTFMDEAPADADAKPPRTAFAGSTRQFLQSQAEPLPLLILRDRYGAFADLWMLYSPLSASASSLASSDLRIAFHDPRVSLQNALKTGNRILKRHSVAEKNWEKDLLETGFIKKESGTSHYYCPMDTVGKSLTFLLEVGWHILDCHGNQVQHHTQITLDMRSEQQDILVRGKIRYAEFEADLSDVVGSFTRRDRFVQLTPGKVGLLPDRQAHAAFDALIEEGEAVSGGIKIRKQSFGALSDMWECASNPQLQIISEDSLSALKNWVQAGAQDLPVALPGPGFKGVLRPYQQAGLDWLAFLYAHGFHGLLADDMGLGKTVQVLSFLSRLAALPSLGPILIVVPTSLIFNWKKEIEKFLPHMSVYVHQSTARLKSRAQLEKIPLIITSYALLRIDLPLWQDMGFHCVILDEAQAIKNPATQSATAAFRLKAHFRLSITGTPIENHLTDLWSQFHFLLPSLLGGKEAFSADVQASASDSRYLQKIKKKIRPFLLRRTKDVVAKDLPKRIDQVVWIEMQGSQREAYEQFLAGVRGGLLKKIAADGLAKHRIEVLEAILRLRQCCCHPILISSQLQQTDYVSAKLETLLQDLETIHEEGGKAIIYSQFTSMLALIAKELQARSWSYVKLDGATKDREEVVMQFQENPHIPFFLVSLKAGGVGLNLTAADYVFLFDPWWNEAVENQAINRAHRIGRSGTVFAKKYIIAESIEEKMLKLKESKSALVSHLLDCESNQINFTEEDLFYLLS